MFVQDVVRGTGAGTLADGSSNVPAYGLELRFRICWRIAWAGRWAESNVIGREVRVVRLCLQECELRVVRLSVGRKGLVLNWTTNP